MSVEQPSVENQEERDVAPVDFLWYLDGVVENWSILPEQQQERAIERIINSPIGELLLKLIEGKVNLEPEAYDTKTLSIINSAQTSIQNNASGIHENTKFEQGLEKLKTKGRAGVERDEFKQLLEKENSTDTALEKRLSVFITRLADKIENSGGILRRRVVYDVIDPNSNHHT
jgi:hypothetical protein